MIRFSTAALSGHKERERKKAISLPRLLGRHHRRRPWPRLDLSNMTSTRQKQGTYISIFSTALTNDRWPPQQFITSRKEKNYCLCYIRCCFWLTPAYQHPPTSFQFHLMNAGRRCLFLIYWSYFSALSRLCAIERWHTWQCWHLFSGNRLINFDLINI